MGKEGGREGVREEGSDGGREEGMEGVMEGGRERGSDGIYIFSLFIIKLVCVVSV